MDTLIDVRELVINSVNPRTISDFMQEKLTQSLLLSPWMMAINPIKIDEESVVWSGNARTKSLRSILEMDEDSIEDMLSQQTIYRNMDDEHQRNLVRYWKKWQGNPEVPCRVLDNFTDDEKRELMVKENLHAGEDDPEMLRKFFDRDLISDFFGSVSWNLYDYADKINDDGAGRNKITMKVFKCGYVEFFITDDEYDKLAEIAEDFKLKHNNSLKGFIAYLLGDEELLDAILYDKPQSEEDLIDNEELESETE